jgi:hypothetical protein
VIKRVIVSLNGGRDDGVVLDTHDGDRKGDARGVYAVTQGKIGEIFLAPSGPEHLSLYLVGEVEYRPHKYRITARNEDEDVLAIRADYHGLHPMRS